MAVRGTHAELSASYQLRNGKCFVRRAREFKYGVQLSAASLGRLNWLTAYQMPAELQQLHIHPGIFQITLQLLHLPLQLGIP